MASEPVPISNGFAPSDSMTGGKLSIKEAFRDKEVLVTGATGYLGSLVLEQLLRVCPEVGKVYVLVRDKKNLAAHARIDQLANSGLFNKLWDKPDVLGKIRVIEGDVTAPDLGLHPDNKAEVLKSVEAVIHSAANIALDDPIQKTLRNNYLSTKNVLELCKQMTSLKAFTHVSTAYVGINNPRGTTVKEKISPLMNGDSVVTHEEVVTELLRLPEEAANEKLKLFQKRWDFPNTYSFGKHLTEQLVADCHKSCFPCTLVRPSFVTGLDKGPYPGYIGNYSGGAGYAIAFALGFFEKNSQAWEGDSVVDLIPGDIVSSVILAATAASLQKRMKEDEIAIFHACSSTTYPITSYEMHAYQEEFFSKEPPKVCLLWGKYPTVTPNYKPNWFLLNWARTKTYLKINMLCWLMGKMGKQKMARRLHTSWRAWDIANQARYDMHLFFSTENTRTLDAMLVDEERADIRCLFTPLNADWKRYFHTFLSGVSTLLLMSPVSDDSATDFEHIQPCEPPISLPRPLEKRPSSFSRTSSLSKTVSIPKSGSVSSAAFSQLARSLSALEGETATFGDVLRTISKINAEELFEDSIVEGFESGDDDDDDGDENENGELMSSFPNEGGVENWEEGWADGHVDNEEDDNKKEK